MAVDGWDPVMLTIYLNELESQEPEPVSLSPFRRRIVADAIVVDLRRAHGSRQQDDGSQRRDDQHQGPESADIDPVNH